MQIPFQENAAAKENGSESKVMSANQAEDLKMKEKRKREREVLVILCAFCNLNTELRLVLYSSFSLLSWLL